MKSKRTNRMIIVNFGKRILFLFALLLTVVAPRSAAFAEESDGSDESAVMSRLASQSLLLDAAVAEDLIVVVGERGHILTSRDAGRTWRQASVPTRVTLTGVFLHDKHLGWAVGHDGVILRTENSGDDWTRLYTFGEEDRPLLDVYFLDKTRGFAVGAYGLFLSTVDAGDTWKESGVSEEDWHLNHITRSKTGRLYIAAEAGNVFRSDDEGATWTSLPSPYTGSFFGTLSLGGDVVLLYGLRGHAFRSEDAGITWNEVATGSEALLSGSMIQQDSTIVLTGQAGTILYSKDNGRHFDLKQLPDRNAFSTAVCTPDGAMLLVGEAGVQRFPE